MGQVQFRSPSLERPSRTSSPQGGRQQVPEFTPDFAPTSVLGSSAPACLTKEERRARVDVILRSAAVPELHPDPAILAERHQRHAAACADHGVRYSPSVILPEDGMPKIVQQAITTQLKRARRLGPLTSGKTVAHAESLRLKEVADLEIRPVGKDVGSGVFAKAPIRRGTFLGEYTGELRFLPADVMWPFLTANGYSFEYGAEISLKKGIVVIDGLEAGNFTRFLNHSYQPNAVSRQLLLEDGMFTYFVAQRDIAAGEQVSINYTRGYWKGRGRPAPL